MTVRFLSAGDRALVVEFGDRIDRALSDRVLRLDASLRRVGLAGVVETVPTFRSLMVHYDPLATTRGDLERAIASRLDHEPILSSAATLWRVPVCYDGEHAPDIGDVAHLTGLSPGEVAALHSGTRYHVYMLGFLPGFPYMGDLPTRLALPRRADPRVRVPAGSISIATTLTAIYPYESPGGWHLIGTTPIRLFDCERAPPALFAPGDKVQFEPIDATAFASIKRAVDSDKYEVEHESITGPVRSLPGLNRGCPVPHFTAAPSGCRRRPQPVAPVAGLGPVTQVIEPARSEARKGVDGRAKPAKPGHGDKGQWAPD